MSRDDEFNLTPPDAAKPAEPKAQPAAGAPSKLKRPRSNNPGGKTGPKPKFALEFRGKFDELLAAARETKAAIEAEVEADAIVGKLKEASYNKGQSALLALLATLDDKGAEDLLNWLLEKLSSKSEEERKAQIDELIQVARQIRAAKETKINHNLRWMPKSEFGLLLYSSEIPQPRLAILLNRVLAQSHGEAAGPGVAVKERISRSIVANWAAGRSFPPKEVNDMLKVLVEEAGGVKPAWLFRSRIR